MHRFAVTVNGQAFEVEIRVEGQGQPGDASSATATARVRPLGSSAEFETVAVRSAPTGGPGDEWYLVNERPYEASVDLEMRSVHTPRGLYPLDVRDLQVNYVRPTSGDGRVKSPIPGVIARLLVQTGQEVLAGQPLLILEAMKMQNEIRAPRAGVVRQIYVQVGEAVPLREALIEIG